MSMTRRFRFFFFFNDTATTEIYTLSLHDALPISMDTKTGAEVANLPTVDGMDGVYFDTTRKRIYISGGRGFDADRKSTRLNSSHGYISYAVFCLKKKKK